MAEQFRMRSKTNEVYLVCFWVKPNQKIVTFKMTFHVAGIVASEFMRIIFFRNRFFILQKLKNFQ